jgi:hypothetical protein
MNTNDSPPVIVIYGRLTDDFKYQEVNVSRSSPYFDDEPNKGISEAVVTIQSSNNNYYHFTEADTIPGLYRSDIKFSAQGGVSYFLSVEVDFNGDGVTEKYEASTTVLPRITIDSLSLESIKMFGHHNYILFMHFQDSPEENYYFFNVAHNDSLLTAKLSDYGISDNTMFKGQYVKGQLYLFDDISNKEKDSEESRKRSVYLQDGDRITAEGGLIPKGFFDFISQCQKEQRGENPMFGGPASNILTNISNGGVGYFTGYCLNRVKIEFKADNFQ